MICAANWITGILQQRIRLMTGLQASGTSTATLTYSVTRSRRQEQHNSRLCAEVQHSSTLHSALLCHLPLIP
jgi:hypothetical protein